MTNIDTIYFIHHSHTDIGYTHDQPIVWDLHERFIDQAIDCAEAWVGRDEDAAFRWTVESTAVLCRWLEHASPAQIDRFRALERAGRIEVTGMLANLTPLCDTDELIESLQPLRRLRHDYGFTIRHAMNCDVNGQNWPLVDLLLDAGIEAFSMAVNPHYGAAPLQRPNAFWWQGPSGRRLLTWNGWLYISGKRFGIGHADPGQFGAVWWPQIETRLALIDYPLKSLMLQSDHPFGDNGSAFGGFADYIARWNAAGRRPRIIFATPAMWWDAVRAEATHLPVYRGDWTDYWNFGCISSAREQAINRASRVRLRTADALAAAVRPAANHDGWTVRTFTRYREEAWHHLLYWDEHTWGADQSIHQPYGEDTLAQWQHKAHAAYQARSLSLLLQRDALAALAQQVEQDANDICLLFNPLPWPRIIGGPVPAGSTAERSLRWDDTAGRHFQDRMADLDWLTLHAAHESGAVDVSVRLPRPRLLKPVTVPAFGYRALTAQNFADITVTTSRAVEVCNHRHCLRFDAEHGGIVEWYDSHLDYQWVDLHNSYPFFGYVHEAVAGRNHPRARSLHYEEVWEAGQVEHPDGWRREWVAERQGATRVLHHDVYATPVGSYVIQQLQAPGVDGMLHQEIYLPTHGDYIECSARWRLGLETHPESTYFLFPFDLASVRTHFDAGGQAVEVEEDQLPGACRDYFTVQQWVDFNDGQRGMTVATPDNPLVQIGGFHFGRRLTRLRPEQALLLGWVTSNYWDTNFRAHQPGEVRARYRLRPYAGSFDEAAAHRFGAEAAQVQLLLQHFGEPRALPPCHARTGSLLQLPGSQGEASNVLTLHVLPAPSGAGIMVRLLNASDAAQHAAIGSAQLQLVAAQRCSLLAEPQDELPVCSGAVTLLLQPREIVTLQLSVLPPTAG